VSAVQTVAPYFQDFDFNIEGENILLRWQHVNDLLKTMALSRVSIESMS
jgi:hypothetical protein